MPSAKPAWLNSLSLKVLLAYVAGVLLSIGLIVAVAAGVMTFQHDFFLKEVLRDSCEELADRLQFDADGNPVGFDPFESAWVFASLGNEVAYRVLDSSGRVLLASAAGQAFWGASRPVMPLARGSSEFSRDDARIYVATEEVVRGGRKSFLQFGTTQRFVSLIYLKCAIPFARGGLTLFNLVLLFVFGACTYVTLRWTLQPLRDLSSSAAAIGPQNVGARLTAVRVPSEISPLVESFNRALGRLENGYRLQREFLGSAAHELKTPLALIRAQIELDDSGKDRESLLTDVEHMTRQVQQLLLWVEASEVQNYDFSVIDPRGVVQEATDYLARMAQAAKVRVSVSGSYGLQWTADRSALFTLTKNLLENAIQHAPAGTQVSAAIEDASLIVRDWGPGVPEAHLRHLFQRFWRGEHRRDHGAGLGLAICLEIAQAHGWRLSARNVGPGLEFVLATAIRT